MLSVVVPAHDEEAVIERCLRALLDAPPDELDVVVVANGCRDRTVALASRFEGVRVVELAEASKHAALNAGAAAARHVPRAYVDADVEVSGRALCAVAAAMERAGAPAGAPALRLDLDACPWHVRAFYRVWLALDWSTDAPIGSGVYVLSEAGHDRVGAIPPSPPSASSCARRGRCAAWCCAARARWRDRASCASATARCRAPRRAPASSSSCAAARGWRPTCRSSSP
jgi:hypothetical protein